MSKRRNFPEERRAEGRALGKLNDMLVESARPFAEREGVDLQARLDEAAKGREEAHERLAERLRQSVLPLFIDDEQGQPAGIGSCVLVRLNSSYFIFTAAHVIRTAGSSPLWVPCADAIKTRLTLRRDLAHMTPGNKSS